MSEKITVKEAMERDYGSIILEFGKEKTWIVEGQTVNTDKYGHLEVAIESLLSSFAGVEEDDMIEEAREKIYAFLAEQQEL